MKVFILIGEYDYEGDAVLSVHATEQSALEAQEERLEKKGCNEPGYNFDDYRIDEWDVLP